MLFVFFYRRWNNSVIPFILFYSLFVIVSQVFFIVFISSMFLIRFLLNNIRRLKNKFNKKINVFVFKVII